MKKPFSIALLILGALLFALGSHEANLAARGEQTLSQSEANPGYRRPTLGPVRRGVRSQENQMTQQSFIEQGHDVLATLMTANWLRGSGLVLFLAGASYFVFFRKKRG